MKRAGRVEKVLSNSMVARPAVTVSIALDFALRASRCASGAPDNADRHQGRGPLHPPRNHPRVILVADALDKSRKNEHFYRFEDFGKTPWPSRGETM